MKDLGLDMTPSCSIAATIYIAFSIFDLDFLQLMRYNSSKRLNQ
jgi:hypothetical protein